MRKRARFAQSDYDKMIELYLSGMSTRQIARDYNTDKGVISRQLKQRGIAQRTPGDRNRKWSVNPHVLDVINNEQAAYWVGFLYADGCVHNRTLSVVLQRRDKSHIEKLAAFLETERPVKDMFNGSGDTAGRTYPAASFYITHDLLAKRLREIGLAKPKDYIEMLANIPPHLFRHWLRGFLDGDGSIQTKQVVSFLGPYELLKVVKKHLAATLKTNPNLTIKKHSKSRVWYLIYGSKSDTNAICEYVYSGATVWLERKRLKYENWG